MGGKPRRNPVTDAQIVASYAITHSGQQTAKQFGIGLSTVQRVLTAHKIQRPGLIEWRKKATRFVGQENAIREAYERGLTFEQLRTLFGVASDYAFKHALRRAGADLRENPAPLLRDGELKKIKTLNALGKGQVPISLALGRSQSFVSRVMRKHGITTNNRGGPHHSMWKGGRFLSGGYVMVWLEKNDRFASMCNGAGYVLEHRLLMAKKLKRSLLKTETVHHINGDRSDNRLKNLELRQGKHGKHVAMCCLDCGSKNIGHARLA